MKQKTEFPKSFPSKSTNEKILHLDKQLCPNKSNEVLVDDIQSQPNNTSSLLNQSSEVLSSEETPNDTSPNSSLTEIEVPLSSGIETNIKEYNLETLNSCIEKPICLDDSKKPNDPENKTITCSNQTKICIGLFSMLGFICGSLMLYIKHNVDEEIFSVFYNIAKFVITTFKKIIDN